MLCANIVLLISANKMYVYKYTVLYITTCLSPPDIIGGQYKQNIKDRDTNMGKNMMMAEKT
jgi:hypothetical protein